MNISIWAEMTSISDRTTNAYESFHSKFNSLFYSHHPYINIYFEIIKKIQIDTKILITTATQKAKKKKGPTNNSITFIEENINKFQTNQILRIEFVIIIAFKHQL